ncbi:hypothetical protein BH10PSE7_BH10PSE7_29580 [soil metagenome]
MTSLRPVISKLAALGILILLLALPALAILTIVNAYEANRRDIADHVGQLARLEAIARYRPDIENAGGAEAEKIFAAWFLSGGDAGIAAAGLQDRLRSLAQARGVEISRAGDMPLQTVDGVVYAGISLDMMGGAEGIYSLFADIDSAQPLLIIERLALRADANGGDPRYDPIPLYASIDIRAALP